jgi:hypothetical protein
MPSNGNAKRYKRELDAMREWREKQPPDQAEYLGPPTEPVLLAQEGRTFGVAACWRVWCPFCVTRHTHSPHEGHRSAHCHEPTSPFKETGYYIILARNWRAVEGVARDEYDRRLLEDAI